MRKIFVSTLLLLFTATSVSFAQQNSTTSKPSSTPTVASLSKEVEELKQLCQKQQEEIEELKTINQKQKQYMTETQKALSTVIEIITEKGQYHSYWLLEEYWQKYHH